MTFISIIPARENSTRLKNKNLKKIDGKPLIYYSIKASINSKYVKKTYLFTDSSKLIKYAKKFPVNADLKRPKSISGKKISMHETINYFIKKKKLKFSKYKYLILLQPTSPQRNSKDIDRACKIILKNKKADSLVSSFKLNNVQASRLMFYDGKYLTLNKNNKFSKDTTVYHRNGPSIVITKIKNITKSNLYENGKILNFVMSKNRSIDIDNLDDFIKAKEKLSKK
jgi:CMP-N,N'-diacetyllegionaminic acid synthase